MPACWTTLRNPGTSWPLPPMFWCCWRTQWFCGTLWRTLHSSPTDPVLLTLLKRNFKKPENLCILTDCTLQYIVFVVTRTNQIFLTKTFIAFFSFTNQIIADLPCCTLKSFSSRNFCKWFEHANIFTLKSNVYCRYSDKYSLLNLINFCIHSLRKHSKILKYSTFLIAKTQVVQFEKKIVKIKIFSSLLI